MRSRVQRSAIIAACGAAMGLGHAASGQTVINISGATLLENYIKGFASTNDYWDVDGDGLARRFGNVDFDQLATFGLPPAQVSGKDGQWWIIQYRAVGSVNGFQELVDFGRTFVTTEDNVEIFSSATSRAFHNRTQYINNGLSSNSIFNSGNPGGAPVRADMTTLQATYSFPHNPSDGGIRIDLAVVDVPARWAVFQEGTPAFNRLPGQPGYGSNGRVSRNKDGTETTFGHKLADLKDANLFDPGNPGAANADTIFDTQVAFAPIAPITSLGTGLREIDLSDLNHLTVTGRARSGENFIAVTRDSGSGTRNGFMNMQCVDPSWGVGDNIGVLSVLPDEHKLGPSFIPTNKVGNSEVETTVGNHRLAIGYAGAERGVTSGWLTGGRAEILAVRNDTLGGTEFSRPTINDVLDNDANGFILGGPAVFSSFGDPKNAPESKGGVPGTTTPAMENVEAAAYLNNLRLSSDAFAGAPGSDPTLFTPGEFIATLLIPFSSTDNVPNPVDPCDLMPNPNFNQSVQDFVRANNVLTNAAFASFGTATLDGKVPTRQLSVVYTDGVAGGANYISQGGAAVIYASNLASRNRIAGDFNGDAKRNVDDVAEMIAAYKSRSGGPAWVAPNGTGDIAGAPGTDAVIEILGDFNGDGNFDAGDLRYWADGLAMEETETARTLNRKLGFELIDAAFGGNVLGTSLANGSYDDGDSRGDVANEAGTVTRGFAPVGFDGVVDDHDIDYVFANFGDWSSLLDAQNIDLSADMTGDLVVDQADVDELFSILETTCGDVNLDGSADGADREILLSNLTTPASAGGFADGDTNGDGLVTNADLACLCYADCDSSTGAGNLDFFDFICFQDSFATGGTYACECDTSTGSGVCDFFDFICFQDAFASGC